MRYAYKGPRSSGGFNIGYDILFISICAFTATLNFALVASCIGVVIALKRTRGGK
jgi:hypothetical protein